VEAWLAGNVEGGASGRVKIVLASDDPDDLTLREARALGSADVLLLERGVPGSILARARADAQRFALPFDGELPPGLVVELRRN